ncbi:MAG: hypothetical protein FWC11_03865, partial [Firmicutes bacterium]|nr:hypothetical protein [Bacillota bacterium]
DNPMVARINSCHYFIQPDDPTAAFQGYGGQLHKIKFFDGRIIETKNLWSQGQIPTEYRDVLPNNAEFI